MKIHLYSPVHFEKWDYRNSTDGGIGGSETCHTEMAWRLARRGYEVHSYSPIPSDCQPEWRGTHWHSLEDANFEEDGLWVFFRSTVEINKLEKKPGQVWWLLLQDEGCTGAITQETAGKIDNVIALCQWHRGHIEKCWPVLRNKIVVSTNGIKVDLIRDIEAEGIPERNPKKLIYASSPDRGLLTLLKIFPKAKEIVPDLELHCFYGVDNIEKLIEFNPRFSHYKGFVSKLKKALDQPGVHWRGRVSQRELYREWLTAGIWAYPTHFGETSCITCMEAQALGAIPITNPYWALAENVRYGVWITGDPQNNSLIQARYVDAIVKVATSPPPIWHNEMQWHARCIWNWERVVDQWESVIHGWNDCLGTQFVFQRRHAIGSVANVGCATDPHRMREICGWYNVDANAIDPVSKRPNPVDLVADARDFNPPRKFDSVVLGDILEHMNEDDVCRTLSAAKHALNDGGRIVITVPDDVRPKPLQVRMGMTEAFYANGVSGTHDYRIDASVIKKWCSKTGLQIQLLQQLDYTFFTGWGLVCV